MTSSKVKAMLQNELITGEMIGHTDPVRWELIFPDVGIEIKTASIWDIETKAHKCGI